MTREEAIERFENVKASALVQKASGVSEYWQNEIDGTIKAIDMAIEALSAEAVKGWIPCSERLPDNRVVVLISVDNYVFPAVFHPNGVYDGKTVWSEYHWTDLETGIIQNQPDAWMPLPTPYKGGDTE